MLSNSASCRLISHLVLAVFALAAGAMLQNATGTPAPKPKPPYALLYIPKKTGQYETTQYRRRQIAFFKSNSVPFVLFWAIRNLKNADLPSLPKKGKGGENRHNNEEDIAWLVQNLKVEYLDGTGVLRISLAAGGRREQALLVNAVVNAYFQLEVDSKKRDYERWLERYKSLMKTLQEELGSAEGAYKKILEQSIVDNKGQIKWCEDALRTLPRLLELADVPPE